MLMDLIHLQVILTTPDPSSILVVTQKSDAAADMTFNVVSRTVQIAPPCFGHNGLNNIVVNVGLGLTVI